VFAKELEYGGGSVEEPGWRVIDIQLTGPAEDRAPKLKPLEDAIRAESVRSNPRAFSFEIALAYNALGETAKALEWLEKSEASSSHGFNFLEVDPRIQNLKNEPRFQKLVESFVALSRRSLLLRVVSCASCDFMFEAARIFVCLPVG
jgi:hypothetical protein